MSKKKNIVILKYHDLIIGLEEEVVEIWDDDTYKYYYEDKNCTINFLNSDIIFVMDLRNHDCDPHGLFEYIGNINVDGFDLDNVEQYDYFGGQCNKLDDHIYIEATKLLGVKNIFDEE